MNSFLTLRDGTVIYIVEPGDSLWGIAGRFFGDPWLWTKLWKMNPNITNPDLIYAGDIIVLSDKGRL